MMENYIAIILWPFLLMTMLQTIMIGIFRIKNIKVLWNVLKGGKIIENPHISFFYVFVQIIATITITYASYKVGTINAILAAIGCFVAISVPTLAWLPWYGMEVLGDAEPNKWFKRSLSSGSSSRANNFEHNSYKRERYESYEDNTRQSSPDFGSDVSYQKACEYLELVPGEFSQAELGNRYKKVMSGIRPDSNGPDARAKLFNHSYETILKHHGWTR